MQTNDHSFAALLNAYSLSSALRELYNSVTVQVISQQLATATAEEQQLLNISEDDSWIREVHILGDGIPRVHGKTVAPFSTYQSYKDQLDNLGDQLLGEAFLYQLPHTRSPFQYTKLENQWLRQSIFYIDISMFLVTELFLA